MSFKGPLHEQWTMIISEDVSQCPSKVSVLLVFNTKCWCTRAYNTVTVSNPVLLVASPRMDCKWKEWKLWSVFCIKTAQFFGRLTTERKHSPFLEKWHFPWLPLRYGTKYRRHGSINCGDTRWQWKKKSKVDIENFLHYLGKFWKENERRAYAWRTSIIVPLWGPLIAYHRAIPTQLKPIFL